MSVLVFSDIHGSSKAAQVMKRAIELYKPERIVLLGDLLDYGEGDVADLIRQYSNIIIACEGNCDYPPNDEISLNISLPHYASFIYEGHTVHISHTCQYVSFPPGDIVMYGHTHIKDLHNDEGVTYLNPGSLSRPRDNCISFAILDRFLVSLINAETSEIISSLEI